MKMIVTWLLGVPVAVAFFFAVFSVDASKISPSDEPNAAKEAVAIAPSGATSSPTKWQSEARIN